MSRAAELDVNFLRSVAKTRLDIINQLHATYGAECAKLRAEVRELKRRVRLAADALGDGWVNGAYQPMDDKTALDLLDLRKPLPRTARTRRKTK